MSASVLSGRPPSLSSQAISTLVCTHFNFTNVSQSDIRPLPSFYDRNYYLKGNNDRHSGQEFVLKLFNPLATTAQCMEGVNQIMRHLSSRGVLCPVPVVSGMGKDIIELSGVDLTHETKESADSKTLNYPVCVLSYLPGETFDSVEIKYLTSTLFNGIGELVAKMDKEMMSFPLDSFVSVVSDDWNMIYFPRLCKYLPLIEDPCNKANAASVFEAFKTKVTPKLSSFRTGIIHGDINGSNVLLKKHHQDYHVAGFVDFSDSIITCTIFEVMVSVTHLLREVFHHTSNISAAVELVGSLVSGYHSVLPLTGEELDSLYYLVLARCVQVAVHGTRHLKEEPDNAKFASHAAKSWRLVNALLSVPKKEVDKIWTECII